MTFDLVDDFAEVLAAMPAGHPRYGTLKLLEEVVRRDVHFVDRHPTTLFQCLWNSCWWHDCAMKGDCLEATSTAGTDVVSTVKEHKGGPLSELVDGWCKVVQAAGLDRNWLQALCRPALGLNSGIVCSIGSPQGPEVRQLAIHGERLLTAHSPGPIKIWDLRTGREVNEIGSHFRWARCAEFSPDGRRVVSGGGDWQARLWNAAGGPIWNVPMHGAVHCARFSPDGAYIAVTSGEAHDSKSQIAMVRVLDAQNGSELAAIRLPRDSVVTDLQYSADGQILFGVFQFARKEAIAWQARDLKEVARITLGENSVSSVHVAEDGRTIAVGCYNGTITLHRFDNPAEIAQVKPEGPQILSVRFSRDGRRLAVSDRQGGLQIFEVATRREVTSVLPPSNVEILEFEDDSRLLLVALDEGVATLYRFDTSRATANPLRAGIRGGNVVFAQEQDRVCITQNQNVTVWETKTGRFIGELEGHAGKVTVVSLPDQRHVATFAPGDLRIGIWDAAHATLVRWVEGFPYAPQQLVFTEQSQLAVTVAFEEALLRVWDTREWTPVAEIRIPPGNVGKVAFCGASKRIALAIVQHDDATWTQRSVILVWDQPSQSEPVELPYDNGQYSVRDLMFEQSGSRLVADGGADLKSWVYQSKWVPVDPSDAARNWRSLSRYPWERAKQAVDGNAVAALIQEDMTQWLPTGKSAAFSSKHQVFVTFTNRELQFFRLMNRAQLDLTFLGIKFIENTSHLVPN